MIKVLQDSKLPILKKIFLVDVGDFKTPSVVNKFLTQISIGTKQFEFDNNCGDLCLSECKQHLEGLKAAAHKVTDEFYLYKMRMEKEDFEEIMISAQHTQAVEFECCYLNIDEALDFKQQLKLSTFHTLDFYRTGRSDFSNWESEGGATFKNIIKGLSKEEGVVKNLKTIRNI